MLLIRSKFSLYTRIIFTDHLYGKNERVETRTKRHYESCLTNTSRWHFNKAHPILSDKFSQTTNQF